MTCLWIVFLGNSMIWLGLDLLVVSQEFESRTGHQILRFNFGVSALPCIDYMLQYSS